MTAEALLSGGAMPPAGSTVTAAFSGGADSTALLLALHAVSAAYRLTLRAVHVHHGIRGAEADRDAAFCAALCKRLHIPFQTVYVDAPAYAAAQHLSLETAARILRYRALEEHAPEGFIATAHHASDNAETVLFHLIRGSGLKGLCGIPPRNGRIIRPLLHAQKDDILRFLAACGQDFISDSTNFLPHSSRNRIRGEIIPLLERENSGAVRHIAAAAQSLSEDAALLHALAQQAADACAVPDGGLRGLDALQRPLRMRIYAQKLRDCCGTDPSRTLLEAIDGAVLAGRGKIALTKDVYAEVWRGILYMTAQPAQMLLQAPQPLRPGCNILPGNRCCEAVCADPAQLSRNLHTADTRSTLDFDKILGTARFQQRRRSDRITLPGRGFASLLHKCVQAEVPPPMRGRLCVLYDDIGCIFCEGVGIAARVKPDANSRRLLLLSCKEAAGCADNNITKE